MRMTSRKNLLAVSLLAAVAAGVRAEGGPNISGFVDVGYNYNLNGQTTNNLRSFDNMSNSITLQNAKLGIDGKLENGVGYKIDLMYGHDASVVNATEDFSPTARDLQFNLQQAFLTFPCPVTGASFSLGKFVTPFGAEVVEAKDNYNISRGFLFAYTVPYSHTGIKADKGFADGKFTTTLGLVNGWDNMHDNNKGKTVIGQVGTTVLPKTSLTLGGAYGPEQATPAAGADSTQGNSRSLVDAILKITPTDKLTLIGNYDWGVEEGVDFESTSDGDMTANWSGIGLHANYAVNDMFSAAFRYENLDDEGSRVLVDRNGDITIDGADVLHQTLNSYTTTVQAKKDNVIYRLEYRIDRSSEYEFVSDKGEKNRKSQSTVGAQVILTF